MTKAKKTSQESEKKQVEEQPVADEVKVSEENVTEQVAQAMSETEATEVEAAEEAESLAEQADEAEPASELEEKEPAEVKDVEEPKNEPVVVTETQSKKHKPTKASKGQPKKTWWQTVLIASGLGLTLLIFVAGAFAQLYKGKTLPNVSVAGTQSAGKSQQLIQTELDDQVKALKITIVSGKKTLTPSLKEIGYSVDTAKTAQAAMDAKRSGLLAKFYFWQKVDVPAVVAVNDTLLAQYLDNKLPELTKAGQDARLVYDANTAQFTVTTEKNGSGPNASSVKSQLLSSSQNLRDVKAEVKTTNKPAKITKTKLTALISPANELLSINIVLKGSAGTFQAQPADIAEWITPTPQKDGSVKLAIDKAKVQSYVEAIGQQISSSPQDRKVIKDKKTGKQVVLQTGHDGTELSDAAGLASQITESIKAGQDVTLQMSIKTAKAKTVNLEGYDKWIEVDLTKQTATAYEHATPVNNFIVATGLPGYDTPTGEYAIYLRVRSQTMTGGSKADGSYYNLPNVEWVSYFYQDYALHGAYWRKVFGYPASHGCVNMTNEDAKWVYNWAPIGTKVIVHY